MSLATFDALDAFASAVSGAVGLPALRRHDSALKGFDASPAPGVGFLLAMDDGDFQQAEFVMGDPPEHEVWVGGVLTFAVEGQASDERNATLRAGVAVLAGVMTPGGRGLAIAGKFEDLRIDRIDRTLVQREGGQLPIDCIEIEFSLFVTAPTPFG